MGDDEISDRRVRARLSCRYGDCYWTVQSASASEMERLWRDHSAEHWQIEPSQLERAIPRSSEDPTSRHFAASTKEGDRDRHTAKAKTP